MDIAPECFQFLLEKSVECKDILNDTEFKQLKTYKRHNFTNTYDHSIRVAVGSAIIAELLNTDVDSAIKVGLVHDMCFVDRHERKYHDGFYVFYHPVEACDNAHKKFSLTDVEANAIKAHMFPLAVSIPMSKVALALTLSDKIIAVYEGLYCIKILRKYLGYLGLKEIDNFKCKDITGDKHYSI